MSKRLSSKISFCRCSTSFRPFNGCLRCLGGVLTLLILCLCERTILAQQAQVNVQNRDAQTVFQLDFYGQGQGSSADFSQAQIDSITEAAQYWVDILKSHGTMPGQVDVNGNAVLDANGEPVQQPVVFNIYYDAAIVGNANAGTNGYYQSQKDGLQTSLPEALMVDGVYVAPVDGGHATINVGSGWVASVGNQSQSGRVANDLTPVLIHELGHALGIATSAGPQIDPVTQEVSWLFPDLISRYDSRLRDNNGNTPLTKPGTEGGKTIGYDETGTNADTIFDMGDPNAPYDLITEEGNPSQVTFVGKNTLELWYGKSYDKLTPAEQRKGIPIQGYTLGPNWNYENPADLNYDPLRWIYNPGGTLSHIDTTNSLMSWQEYRSYPGFIEVELAMMQDLDYTVERRNFFGKSFYVDGDGETPFYNSASFAYWDAEKQGYDYSRPNDAVYAIGAHLFAQNLNILQTGNIWANGPGAAGVRIDGANNKFTLMGKTSITTDGRNGIGILAAYGKDHTITLQQGSIVRATGRGGIGVSFDFGIPTLGDERGSYHSVAVPGGTDDAVVNLGYLPELYGSLVKDFNVSGTITGSEAGQTATYNTSIDVPDDSDFVPDPTDPRNFSWLEPWANSPVSRPFDWGAAIYIDDSAQVDNINIMSGASINGDILSRRSPVPNDGTLETAAINKLKTTISFGRKADANGSATNEADKNFYFAFKDNINYFRYELQPNILVHLGNGEYTTVSPAAEGPLGDDQFWRFTTWDEFFDHQDDITIVRPGDGYVYADVVTEGSSTTDLHFVGGTTEFMGSTAYVNSVTIDTGATLTLTPAAQPVNSTITVDGIAYNVSRLTDVLKVPEIHIDADSPFYDEIGRTFPDTRIYPLGTEQRHPNPPTMVNSGRISGDGAFYFGQRRYAWDENMEEQYGLIGVASTYWTGTLKNEGTIAPGSKNGADVGIIRIQGDLEFTKNSVYELTIGGAKETRLHSGILADGKYVDQFGQIYDPTIGVFRGENTTEFQGTGNDLIVVANNTKMDGTLKVNVLPDSIFGNETTTHTIIQSGTFTPNSSFKNIEYSQGFLYVSDVFINPFNTHEAQLKVIRELDYFGKRGKTYNETAVAQAVDSSLFDNEQIAFSLGDSRNKEADLRDVFRQMGGAFRANSALINLWTPSELLFNRIGWGSGQMNTDERGRVNWDRISGKTQRMLGQAPDCNTRTGSLWGDYFNTTVNGDADGNSDAYNIMRNGFMVGGEMNLSPYSAIGGIVSYADSNLRQRGDKMDSDDYMLGAYFVCAPFNEFEFKSYLGLGFQEYATNRYVRNANIVTDSITGATGINDHYQGKTQGNTLNFAFEFARPLMLHRTFIVRPTLGFDFQWLWQDAFKEKDFTGFTDAYGSYRYGLQYSRLKFDRSLLRIGFNTETTGSRGGIRMRAFYVTNMSGEGTPYSTAAFVGGGNSFTVRGVELGKNFLNLGVGANLWLDGERTSSFFLDYDSNLYTGKPKTDAHTFSIGLLQNF